jgi:pimeloyl-ACP methyl ester carboxylesterase
MLLPFLMSIAASVSSPAVLPALPAPPALSARAAAPTLVDRSIDVNGTTLHIRCGGERKAGQPLVVLEAGAFNSADTWRDVHAPIAEFARVCAYDRPGRGTSPTITGELTTTEFVELIRGLLQRASEAPPYLIVGHSMGGLIAMHYAALHPSEVTAMVLVDSSHEDQMRRFDALPRLPQGSAPKPPAAMASMPPEAVSFVALTAALQKRPWRGEIPLIVLSRGKPNIATDANAAARDVIWSELQRDLATRARKAEHVVAKKSGHYIHNDEPQLVIDAVRRIVTFR